MCECCLGARCVIPCKSYIIKRGIHVQGRNTTPTAYFTGRHNNNNKNGEEKNRKLGEKVFFSYIIILNMFIIYTNMNI